MENSVGTAVLPTAQAAAILDSLRSQAATILSSALGSTPLVSFATGGLGNFPYNWQNPSNLQFNANTYNWINANLLAGASPIQQATGSFFTNEFISALGSITYTLSNQDQATLNAATANATNQQAAILNQWVAIYGALPPTTPTQTPTDVIVSTICTSWASTTPCTLMQIQNSKNLNALLGNTPASGKPILPLLSNWLNALGSSVSLQNAVSMNNGYLANALANVQTPTVANGGLQVGATVFPAYSVATPMSSILNELADTSNAITLQMSVSTANSSEYSVSVSGGAGFNIPFLDFFGISIGSNANYFQSDISSNATSIDISMTYTGITLVQYAPTAFNESTSMNWFYMAPILQAIQLGPNNTTVSGYKFSPQPGIDFSANGPFGLTQGCAIANYPSVKIVVTSSNYQSIASAFNSSTSVGLSFLGIPLCSSTVNTYSSSSSTDASANQVTITLSPPANLVAGTALTAEGWILGVQPFYPAA
jgi:hypothetical protein